MIKGENTQIYKLCDIFRSRNGDFDKYNFAFLASSATPMSSTLQASLSSVLKQIFHQKNYELFKRLSHEIDRVATNRSSSKLPASPGLSNIGEVSDQCCTLLKTVTVMRRVGSLFHGSRLLELPELDQDVVRMMPSPRARQEDFVCKMSHLRDDIKQAVSGLDDDAASHAQDGLFRDLISSYLSAGQDSVPSNLAPPSAALSRLLGSFPSILDLDKSLVNGIPMWLNRTCFQDIRDVDGLVEYFSGQRDIDIITKHSMKLDYIVDYLGRVIADREPGRSQADAMVYKKHLTIFAPSPGEVAIIAAFLHKRRSSHWNVAWVRSSTAPRDVQLLQASLKVIPIDSVDKPSIIVATVDVLGTGVQLLSACNHAILFRLPSLHDKVRQAKGRFYRPGQRYTVHWRVLVSPDGLYEPMTIYFQQNNINALSKFLSDAEYIPLALPDIDDRVDDPSH